MKFIIVFALIAVYSFFLNAQTMQQKMIVAKIPVTFACVRSGAGGQKNITWQTDYGSQSREMARSLTYTCSIRWLGKTPTNAVVDARFFGVPANGGSDETLDSKSVEVFLNPSSNCVVTITSEEIKHDTNHYAAIGADDNYGEKLRGCFIRLVMDGQIVRAYSSLPHMLPAAWKIE